MIPQRRHFVGWFLGAFRFRAGLLLENLVLRQQLMAPHASGRENAQRVGWNVRDMKATTMIGERQR
jgi:hypothetical protein